jgi:flagellin
VDVAQESTQLARFNILVQSGTAMLSQANQSAQIALKLLG